MYVNQKTGMTLNQDDLEKIACFISTKNLEAIKKGKLPKSKFDKIIKAIKYLNIEKYKVLDEDDLRYACIEIKKRQKIIETQAQRKVLDLLDIKGLVQVHNSDCIKIIIGKNATSIKFSNLPYLNIVNFYSDIQYTQLFNQADAETKKILNAENVTISIRLKTTIFPKVRITDYGVLDFSDIKGDIKVICSDCIKIIIGENVTGINFANLPDLKIVSFYSDRQGISLFNIAGLDTKFILKSCAKTVKHKLGKKTEEPKKEIPKKIIPEVSMSKIEGINTISKKLLHIYHPDKNHNSDIEIEVYNDITKRILEYKKNNNFEALCDMEKNHVKILNDFYEQRKPKTII